MQKWMSACRNNTELFRFKLFAVLHFIHKFTRCHPPDVSRVDAIPMVQVRWNIAALGVLKDGRDELSVCTVASGRGGIISRSGDVKQYVAGSLKDMRDAWNLLARGRGDTGVASPLLTGDYLDIPCR